MNALVNGVRRVFARFARWCHVSGVWTPAGEPAKVER